MHQILIYLAFLFLGLGGISKILLHVCPRNWIMNIESKSPDVLKSFEGKPPYKKWLNNFGRILWYLFYGSIFSFILVVLVQILVRENY